MLFVIVKTWSTFRGSEKVSKTDLMNFFLWKHGLIPGKIGSDHFLRIGKKKDYVLKCLLFIRNSCNIRWILVLRISPLYCFYYYGKSFIGIKNSRKIFSSILRN